MRRLVVLLLLGACARPIVVRMARPGELPPQPHTEVVVGTKHSVQLGCRTRGGFHDAYYQPLAEFVRAHLVTDRFDEPLRVRRALRWPRLPKRQGYEIVVEPRSGIGRVTVGIRLGRWFAQTEYCAHVIDPTTIVLDEGTTAIK